MGCTQESFGSRDGNLTSSSGSGVEDDRDSLVAQHGSSGSHDGDLTSNSGSGVEDDRDSIVAQPESSRSCDGIAQPEPFGIGDRDSTSSSKSGFEDDCDYVVRVEPRSEYFADDKESYLENCIQ